MKTVNVSELEGAALDWAVGQALRYTLKEIDTAVPMDVAFGKTKDAWIKSNEWHDEKGQRIYMPFEPSTNWSQGGPLIESEKVAILNETFRSGWMAICMNAGWQEGPTPLIAACRAIVAAKLGSTVEVPEELT